MGGIKTALCFTLVKLSVVDVVSVLTDSDNPRKYWSVLKTHLKKEGNELATNCSQLKKLQKNLEKIKTFFTSTAIKFVMLFDILKIIGYLKSLRYMQEVWV